MIDRILTVACLEDFWILYLIAVLWLSEIDMDEVDYNECQKVLTVGLLHFSAI